MDRRDFLATLAIAAGGTLPLGRALASDKDPGEVLYDLGAAAPGSVSLMHFTDCHAQLLPIWFREPSVNIGVGAQSGKVPHLVGEALLRESRIARGSPAAYALACLDYVESAKRFGKVGGFAHLATLVQRVRAARPGALLLDGGDTWQGSATALWTEGRDMIAACRQLGVDIMTGHWEFTLGAERVRQIVDKELDGRIEFVAQNVRTADFGDAVFKPWVMREIRGVPVAIIGQAFPYTPIANPRWMVPDWTFGILESGVQDCVDAARKAGAQVVVLLSHNGMDVDLKLAARVHGLDAILGGHTHDGVARPVYVANAGGRTLVSNAGSNGKFLGVIDFELKSGRVHDIQYRLLPVFADLLPADPAMQALIDKVRAPYAARLGEPLALSEGLLYRRGNFNGSFDQLILDALMQVRGAEIAFSPGFRWGTSLLPGETITREHLMDQTAISYPRTTLNNMTGTAIKAVLEDVCDNLFNSDPYYQQGGDMVRVGGLSYTCSPNAASGQRISDMRLGGKPLEADRSYKVAGWASVSEDVAHGDSPPVWDVVEAWLKARKTIPAVVPEQPRLLGVDGNPGWLQQG
ncbi:MAG: thiosulfohydrolase SoxB [Pseudomonadota bacterium]|nr:thiosulfohydrolase SoxB [Pseudomonadota bacterium]